MRRTPLFIALLLLPVTPHAQELAAGANSVQQDTSAIAMALDAKNTAILAILQKLTVCNAGGKFYRPSTAGADAQGCVAPSAASDPDVAKLLVCNASQALYDPLDPKATAQGCVALPSPTYYFAACTSTVARGGIVTQAALTAAGVWPSGFDNNSTVVGKSGALPAGTYEAMGHCPAPGATLWRKKS